MIYCNIKVFICTKFLFWNFLNFIDILIFSTGLCVKGSSIKDVGIFWTFFDPPLPHVGILTLIYLTSTF